MKMQDAIADQAMGRVTNYSEFLSNDGSCASRAIPAPMDKGMAVDKFLTPNFRPVWGQMKPVLWDQP